MSARAATGLHCIYFFLPLPNKLIRSDVFLIFVTWTKSNETIYLQLIMNVSIAEFWFSQMTIINLFFIFSWEQHLILHLRRKDILAWEATLKCFWLAWQQKCSLLGRTSFLLESTSVSHKKYKSSQTRSNQTFCNVTFSMIFYMAPRCI